MARTAAHGQNCGVARGRAIEDGTPLAAISLAGIAIRGTLSAAPTAKLARIPVSSAAAIIRTTTEALGRSATVVRHRETTTPGVRVSLAQSNRQAVSSRSSCKVPLSHLVITGIIVAQPIANVLAVSVSTTAIGSEQGVLLRGGRSETRTPSASADARPLPSSRGVVSYAGLFTFRRSSPTRQAASGGRPSKRTVQVGPITSSGRILAEKRRSRYALSGDRVSGQIVSPDGLLASRQAFNSKAGPATFL